MRRRRDAQERRQALVHLRIRHGRAHHQLREIVSQQLLRMEDVVGVGAGRARKRHCVYDAMIALVGRCDRPAVWPSGVAAGGMRAMLLRKVEELTLYVTVGQRAGTRRGMFAGVARASSLTYLPDRTFRTSGIELITPPRHPTGTCDE